MSTLTGFHGLGESVVNDDGLGRDGASRPHQRTFLGFGQQLVQALTTHVDRRCFRLQRDQQLVRVARRRYTSLQQHNYYHYYIIPHVVKIPGVKKLKTKKL